MIYGALREHFGAIQLWGLHDPISHDPIYCGVRFARWLVFWLLQRPHFFGYITEGAGLPVDPVRAPSGTGPGVHGRL